MIKCIHINICDGSDYLNYQDIMNDLSIKILLERYNVDKEGTLWCTIKYDEPTEKKSSSSDCSPCRNT